jgi:hypothetical protein
LISYATSLDLAFWVPGCVEIIGEAVEGTGPREVVGAVEGAAEEGGVVEVEEAEEAVGAGVRTGVRTPKSRRISLRI